jgi:hypothetical protein
LSAKVIIEAINTKTYQLLMRCVDDFSKSTN